MSGVCCLRLFVACWLLALGWRLYLVVGRCVLFFVRCSSVLVRCWWLFGVGWFCLMLVAVGLFVHVFDCCCLLVDVLFRVD